MRKQLALIVGALALLGIGILIGSGTVRSAFAGGFPMGHGHMGMMKMMNSPGHQAMIAAMASGDPAAMQEACQAFMATDEGREMMKSMAGMHKMHHGQ